MSKFDREFRDDFLRSPEFYAKITDQSVFTLTGAFDIDKAKLLFRTFDKNAAAGSKAKQTIEFYMSVPELALLCHNILSGNIKKRLEKGIPVESYYKGSKRKGKVFSRVLTITKSNKGVYFTAYEGPGKEIGTGAIKPAFDFKGSDHVKLYTILDWEQLKSFAIQGQVACRFYYDHYFGRMDSESEGRNGSIQNSAGTSESAGPDPSISEDLPPSAFFDDQFSPFEG